MAVRGEEMEVVWAAHLGWEWSRVERDWMLRCWEAGFRWRVIGGCGWEAYFGAKLVDARGGIGGFEGCGEGLRNQ